MAKPTETTKDAAAPGGTALGGTSLGVRIFLLSAAIVSLALGAAVLTTHFFGRSVADRVVRERLAQSSEVQSMIGQSQLNQLYLQALTVSDDPNFVSYLIRAIGEGDMLSLTDQLDERQRSLGFSFALVLDGNGQIVARTDRQGGETDFTNQSLFKAAQESNEVAADGLWAREGKLYYGVLVPLSSAGVLQGYLVAAYLIDEKIVADLKSSTKTEVAFTLGSATPAIAATSLGESQAKELVDLLKKNRDLLQGDRDNPRQKEVELDRLTWLAQARPIAGVDGEPLGHVINLGSLAEARQPFESIQKSLGIVGLIALALALATSAFFGRRLIEPVKQLAKAAKAAAGGEFGQRIDGSAGGEEVAQLASTFNSLLSELREQRDMQTYLSELSRTLPDQEGVAAASVPAAQRTVTLVGFEIRGYSKSLSPVLPARVALEQLAKDLRRMARAVLFHNGEIESSFGHRIVASFEGPRRSERALSAAADLVAYNKDPQIVVVMATGLAISGTITWQTKPNYALVGDAIETTEALLRVARPGALLLSKNCRDEIDEMLRLAGVEAQEHKSSVTEQSLFSIAAEGAARLAGPEQGATQEMTLGLGATAAMRTTGFGSMTLTGIGPGSVLGDRFEILSQLGAGGMGVVYKARDRSLKELIALKMLKFDAFGDPESLEKLKDELKLARKISHPNVLRTFDFGEAEGYPFISMEFVRGVTLKKLLDESGRLPLSAGLHIARQLCRGLAAAHGQAVLHRDIKPENMIIEATGNAKLMDFGIAQPIQRKTSNQTKDGTIVGTPFYLAPEQIEGVEPDVRADIYAVGVVLFEIFTGELPFPASGNLMQIITRKLNEAPLKPGNFWPEIPKDLEATIMRCLERDRDKRYPTVSMLLADLEQLRA